jgi:hypothetical protein
MKSILAFVRSLSVLTVVLATLFTVGIALAAELVTNGNFNSDFTTGPWVVPADSPGTADYDNAVGHIANGSAFLVAPGGGQFSLLDQCVLLDSPSDSYVSVSAWVRFDTTDPLSSAKIIIDAYDAVGCVDGPGESVLGDSAVVQPAGTAWLETRTGTAALSVPAGTKSLSVHLYLEAANDDTKAWFDDVTVHPSGPTAVTLNDFSAQPQASSTVWVLPVALLAALAGVWFMARRRRA